MHKNIYTDNYCYYLYNHASINHTESSKYKCFQVRYNPNYYTVQCIYYTEIRSSWENPD